MKICSENKQESQGNLYRDRVQVSKAAASLLWRCGSAEMWLEGSLLVVESICALLAAYWKLGLTDGTRARNGGPELMFYTARALVTTSFGLSPIGICRASS